MFQYIYKIENTKEKKFFIEKVNLFIRLINVFAQKNNLVDSSLNSDVSRDTIKRLKELEIIESYSEDEQKQLLKVLNAPLFMEFITAVNYNLKYQKLIGDLLNNLDPSKRKIIQEKSKKKAGPRTIDFFCGAGGLSLGFSQEGYKVDLANDYEDVCIETFKYNHPEVPDNRVILDDIRNIVDHIEDYVNSDIDVVIGGPPCQGFSSANQQRIIDDPRNELYKYFLKAVTKIAPKFVVMENVKGMLPYAEQVIEDYQNIKIEKTNKILSYSVACKVLISDDFGVAQKRQRLIFIAIRNDISKKRKITPIDLFEEIDKNNQKNKNHVLRDAIEFIKPLDSPRIKNMTEVDDEITGKKVDVNLFNGNENPYLKLINEGRKIDYVFNHKARYANDINYEIYGTLEQGEDGTSEKIKHIMPYKHRNHIFKDKYFKLVEDKPSRTITAHLKMDCHSHIHPRQVRSITPREAARIQSFPDDYVFLGAYLKTYMQIGNAVPPVMARGIAKVIKKYI
ncbi:DNA cytosine methyltransferase [Hyunsoonleella aestuarii]|uniref:Cytosine-specific methyltransferase n=1 Tax=Hyunsoonleella aestuarii TaxID=912802 RepID=A0ABP8EEB7_9FLAO|nr:DNA cytosine methyltransferase [Hyunsoonleella aestuarii]